MKLDRYFHCKNCLGKKQPSGIMEAGVKDDTMFVLCKTCGEPVFKTALAPDIRDHMAKTPCPCCTCEEEN